MEKKQQPPDHNELDYALNIGNINGGAVPEVFARLNAQIMENIRDVNTSATATREITLKLQYKPSPDRKTALIIVKPVVKLAPATIDPSTIHISKVNGKPVGFIHDPAQDELQFSKPASPAQQ